MARLIMDRSKFYDVDAFVDGVKAAGIQVTGNEPGYHTPNDKHAIRVPSQDLQSLLEPGLSNQLRHQTHLSIECPLFKLDTAVVGRHRELVESVLSSLVPAPAQRAQIDQLKASLGKFGHYNVLHLRIERDWISHCKTWASDRGVCLAQEVVHAIGKHLDLKGVPRGTLLYVACDLPAADPEQLNAAVHSLKAMGYDKITLQGRPRKGKSKQGKRRQAQNSVARYARCTLITWEWTRINTSATPCLRSRPCFSSSAKTKTGGAPTTNPNPCV